MLKSILALLALPIVLALLALAPASATPQPAPLGPGGVLELHEKLFAALDKGDAAAVKTMLGGHKRGLVHKDDRWAQEGLTMRTFLVDGKGTPRSGDGVEAAVKLLFTWDGASKKNPRWKTTILEGWMDCPSEEISFATLQFERTRTVGDEIQTKRYRSTSLVSHTKRGWKLWHFHVSPAE